MTSKVLVVGLMLAVISPAAAHVRTRRRAAWTCSSTRPTRSPRVGGLPVQVRVFGFPRVSALAPLAGATIEATWDPESLGKKVASAPPVVSAKSDAEGRAHLEVDVPHGAGSLKLLLSARFGEHQRTRELPIRAVARARDRSARERRSGGSRRRAVGVGVRA